MPSHKVQLVLSGRVYDTIPAGLGKCNLTTEKEDDQVFHRKKFSGALTFRGRDFRLLKALEATSCCSYVEIRVIKVCNYLLEWKGRFKFQDCTINETEQTLTVNKYETLDGYSLIFQKWDTQVNMVGKAIGPFFKYAGDVSQGTSGNEASFERGFLLSSMIWNIIRESFGPEYTYPTFLQIGEAFSEERFPKLKRAVYYHASDFVRPVMSTPSSKILMSFKDFTKFMADAFNVWWFINAEGKIQFEHESYFPEYSYTAKPHTNLNTDKIQKINKTRGYAFDTSEQYGKLSLELSGNSAFMTMYKNQLYGDIPQQVKRLADFSYGTIDFDNECSPKDEKGERVVKSINVQDMITAVGYVKVAFSNFFNGNQLRDTFQDNVDRSRGFLILDIVMDGVNGSIASEKTDIANEVLLNGHFAASNLVRYYRRSNLPFNVGLFNKYEDNLATFGGILRAATSVQYTKALDEIKVPNCCDDSYPYDALFDTYAGIGRLVSSRMELDTDELKVNVLTASNCNVILNIPEPDGGENENPCLPYGTVLRSDYEECIPVDQSGDLPPGTQQYEIIADGKCGEIKQFIGSCN